MDTPTLKDMGITSPGEIVDFSVRNKSPKTDVMTVYYKRKSMSFLPVRRTYEFGRSIKTVVTDSGSATMEDTFELSPVLLAATRELQQLLGQAGPGKDPKEVIIEGFDALRSEIAAGKLDAELARKLEDLGRLIREL